MFADKHTLVPLLASLQEPSKQISPDKATLHLGTLISPLCVDEWLEMFRASLALSWILRLPLQALLQQRQQQRRCLPQQASTRARENPRSDVSSEFPWASQIEIWVTFQGPEWICAWRQAQLNLVITHQFMHRRASGLRAGKLKHWLHQFCSPRNMNNAGTNK